jgi:hypothetical protein
MLSRPASLYEATYGNAVALACASKPGILPGTICTNRGSLTSPSHKNTLRRTEKLPNGPQNAPKWSPREPIFLSNNPPSYWTERMDPKGAEKEASTRAVALEVAQEPGNLLPE